MWKRDASKVLIIDDSVSSVLAISKLLKGDNYSIMSSCGARGFELAMKERPDIILLDLLLENRNGFSLLRNLKSNLWTKNIPVIIVTELNTQAYWDESYQEGADGYIVKNLHFASLAKKIRDYTSRDEPFIPYRKPVWPNYLSRNKTKVLQ